MDKFDRGNFRSIKILKLLKESSKNIERTTINKEKFLNKLVQNMLRS